MRVLQRIVVIGLVGLGVLGCHLRNPPVPAAPPATEFEAAATPAGILRSAAHFLREKGWSVAPLDTAARQLQAEHRARGDANGEWMECVNGVGRTGDTRRATKDLTSTVVVHIRAQPSAGGSLVRIMAGVPSAYSIFAFSEKGPPEYAIAQCVSSGAIENRLRDFLLGTVIRQGTGLPH